MELKKYYKRMKDNIDDKDRKIIIILEDLASNFYSDESLNKAKVTNRMKIGEITITQAAQLQLKSNNSLRSRF